MTSPEYLQSAPVEVTVKNWADAVAKPRLVSRTTFKTYILDPTGGVGVKSVQISDYEPGRIRTVIQSIDAAIAVVAGGPPTLSPDTASATAACQGRFIPGGGDVEFILYGPDALWLNSLNNTATRVTVTKEYV